MFVALDPFPVSTASKHHEETTSDQRKEQLGMGPLAKWKKYLGISDAGEVPLKTHSAMCKWTRGPISQSGP